VRARVPVRISEEVPLLLRDFPIDIPTILLDPIFLENDVMDENLVETAGRMIKRMRGI
jgi:hypothetical protein